MIPGDQVDIELDAQDIENSMSRSSAWQTFIDMDEVSLCQTAYFIQILLNILIGQFVVYEVTGEIFIV